MSLAPYRSEPCPACGVPAGAACVSAGGFPMASPHRERLRGVPLAGTASRARAADEDVRAVRHGALTAHETYLHRDDLDAWRVSLVCVCLSRVQYSRARPVIDHVMALCPRPLVALSRVRHGGKLLETLSPLGHARARANAIARLSVAQIHDRAVETAAPAYAREAIRLFVVGDLSFVPQDKILRAAHWRLCARACLHVVT